MIISIINFILWFSLGAVLGANGISYTTGAFWCIIGIVTLLSGIQKLT